MKHRTRTATAARRAYYEEVSRKRWVARQIGPRRVGGIYRCGYSDTVYEVLALEPGPRAEWPTWQITVRTVGTTEIRRHCIAWDERRDEVVAEPQDEAFAPAWAAWQLAHDPHPWAPRDAANPDDPEWRHLLDEIAHPATTTAFHQLAQTA